MATLNTLQERLYDGLINILRLHPLRK